MPRTSAIGPPYPIGQMGSTASSSLRHEPGALTRVFQSLDGALEMMRWMAISFVDDVPENTSEVIQLIDSEQQKLRQAVEQLAKTLRSEVQSKEIRREVVRVTWGARVFQELRDCLHASIASALEQSEVSSLTGLLDDLERARLAFLGEVESFLQMTQGVDPEELDLKSRDFLSDLITSKRCLTYEESRTQTKSLWDDLLSNLEVASLFERLHERSNELPESAGQSLAENAHAFRELFCILQERWTKLQTKLQAIHGFRGDVSLCAGDGSVRLGRSSAAPTSSDCIFTLGSEEQGSLRVSCDLQKLGKQISDDFSESLSGQAEFEGREKQMVFSRFAEIDSQTKQKEYEAPYDDEGALNRDSNRGSKTENVWIDVQQLPRSHRQPQEAQHSQRVFVEREYASLTSCAIEARDGAPEDLYLCHLLRPESSLKCAKPESLGLTQAEAAANDLFPRGSGDQLPLQAGYEPSWVEIFGTEIHRLVRHCASLSDRIRDDLMSYSDMHLDYECAPKRWLIIEEKFFSALELLEQYWKAWLNEAAGRCVQTHLQCLDAATWGLSCLLRLRKQMMGEADDAESSRSEVDAIFDLAVHCGAGRDFEIALLTPSGELLASTSEGMGEVLEFLHGPGQASVMKGAIAQEGYLAVCSGIDLGMDSVIGNIVLSTRLHGEAEVASIAA